MVFFLFVEYYAAIQFIQGLQDGLYELMSRESMDNYALAKLLRCKRR